MENINSLKEKQEVVSADMTSQREEEKSIKWLRWSKTVLLVLSYFGMGMTRSLVFACIPDLRVRLDTDVEGMSYAFSLGSFGALVALPLAAVADRVGHFSELILGGCLTFSAIINIIRPYTSKLWVFGVCEFVDDVAWTLTSNVGNSLVILMWGASGNSPLHAMHFGYPVGASVGGQIARAFVSQNTTTENTTTTTSLAFWSSQTDTFWQWPFFKPLNLENSLPQDMRDFPDNSRIEIGFLITSGFNLILALAYFLFQFSGKSKLKKQASKQSYKWSEILYPSKWAGGHARFGLFIFIMATCFQVALQGCDKGFSQYLTTYAVDSDLGFDNQEAATLSSVYYLLDAVGIFSCIFIARHLSIKAMFLIEVHGILLLSVLLIIFGMRNRVALYILVPAFALFKGPCWATSYGWQDYYIVLLSALLGITRISRSVTDIFMNALQGYLYTNVGIETIFYTTFAYGALLCLLVYIVYYFTWNKPGRHQLAGSKGIDVYVNPLGEESIKQEKEVEKIDYKTNWTDKQTVTTHL